MIRTGGDRPHARRSFLPRKRNGVARRFHEGSRCSPSSRPACVRLDRRVFLRAAGAMGPPLDSRFRARRRTFPRDSQEIHFAQATLRGVRRCRPVMLGRGASTGSPSRTPRLFHLSLSLSPVPTCRPFHFSLSRFSWLERFAFGLKLV